MSFSQKNLITHLRVRIMEKCKICGNSIFPHQTMCNPCQEQKDRMEEIEKQKKRDAAFGSPWDVIRKRREEW